MTLRITKIEIRNFRSIRNLTISPCELAVLVGKNDSGKSNVLRALNLFFTRSLDPASELDFENEHNVFNKPNRRAKEISIKLEMELPESYQSTNGHFITWEKRWRNTGLVDGHTNYTGFRRFDGKRGVRVKAVDIPDRSHLHALLRNINFVYVPAIKDLEYFSELRSSIYNVVAEVADREFRESSQGFENSIAKQLEDLTDYIANSLDLRSRLALPKDLSHIFESLDFLSEGEDISLDARGDGVKARHIPLILKFMADKKRELRRVQGASPHTFIWAYEEPENNLELASCIELADQFWSFLEQGINQVFLTTHSPVFYNLHRKQGGGQKRISCHYIFRVSGEDGTKEATKLSDLDERMGTMALFSPLVQELEERIREQEEARLAAKDLARTNRRKLFVEGPSDKMIIEKALGVFAPDKAGEIDVESQDSAGVNYVVDMLSAWRSIAKHNPELPRAAGLVDRDDEGNMAARKWNEMPGNVKSAKCFLLPVPPHLVPVLKANFNVPVILETIYNRQAWEWAEQRGYLIDRKIHNVIHPKLADRILAGKTALDEQLDEAWAIFVKKDFNQAGKLPVARYFSNIDDKKFSKLMPFLKPMVSDIVAYLFTDGKEPA